MARSSPWGMDLRKAMMVLRLVIGMGPGRPDDLAEGRPPRGVRQLSLGSSAGGADSPKRDRARSASAVAPSPLSMAARI